MNVRSFQVGLVVIAILILASIGVFQLFRSRVLNKPKSPTPTPLVVATPSPTGGFGNMVSPTPIAGTTPPSQPATGSDTQEVRNVGITVNLPLSKSVVSSPVKVSGQANVFEGNVQIRVKDAKGNILGLGSATACMDYDACPFEASVVFEPSTTSTGTVEVFSPSGHDGSSQHLQIVHIKFN
ncbi:MAG: Gmad2 immunoglobulin-like domain-containing protein [Candidatus Curtissbacteria bacterium]|nr:Gmad2 immunoglobulin-like domain-containing protein [Candidatus Curtissbacteria bacterium]